MRAPASQTARRETAPAPERPRFGGSCACPLSCRKTTAAWPPRSSFGELFFGANRPLPLVTVDVYARRYPVTPVAARDRLTRYPVSNEPAVWWWTVLAPRGGRILPPAWVHSHRARYGGLLLVEGSYSPCSLAGLGPNCTGSGLATPPAGLAEARRALREAAGSSLVCEDDEQLAPSYVRLPEDPRSGTGGYYDRPGSLRCEPADLSRGAAYTVFSFSTPRWARGVDPFPQHTMLFMYVDGSASESELAETFPASYGRWGIESGEYRGSIDLHEEHAMAAAQGDVGAGEMIGYRISPASEPMQWLADGLTKLLRVGFVKTLAEAPAAWRQRKWEP